jgi:hypothetical protein
MTRRAHKFGKNSFIIDLTNFVQTKSIYGQANYLFMIFFVMHNLELATTFYRQSSSTHKLREKQRIKKCDDTKFMSQKKIKNAVEIFVLQAII